jgi:hypothetical protein
VRFSEAVLVNTSAGTPRLQLETGAIDRYAIYSGGSGTNTLSFSYTVQAGDSSADLDQLSANALELNGGTIKDAAGNSASLTLAAPGATGSLGANANLVINTSAPAAPGLSLTSDTGSSNSDRLTNNPSITVTGLEAGASWQYSTNSGVNWSASLSATTNSFSVAAGSYTTGQVQVRQSDAAGNSSPVDNTFQAFTVDTTAPTAPTLALASDTGSSNSDGITNNGTINVAGLEAGASWQYSTNGGSSWTNGTGTGFSVAPGSYTTGQVLVRHHFSLQ